LQKFHRSVRIANERFKLSWAAFLVDRAHLSTGSVAHDFRVSTRHRAGDTTTWRHFELIH
jgi:hypothetical protein